MPRISSISYPIEMNLNTLTQSIAPKFAERESITANTAVTASLFFRYLPSFTSDSSHSKLEINQQIRDVQERITAKIVEGMQWGYLRQVASAIKNFFVYGEATSSPYLLLQTFRVLSQEQKIDFLHHLHLDLNKFIVENIQFTDDGVRHEPKKDCENNITKKYKAIADFLFKEIPSTEETSENNIELRMLAVHIQQKVLDPISGLNWELNGYARFSRDIQAILHGIRNFNRTFDTEPSCLDTIQQLFCWNTRPYVPFPIVPLEHFEQLTSVIASSTTTKDLYLASDDFARLFTSGRLLDGEVKETIIRNFTTALNTAKERILMTRE